MAGFRKPQTQQSLASGLFSVVQKHCQSVIFARARSVSTASQLLRARALAARLTNLTLQRLLIEQTRDCLTPGFFAIDDSRKHHWQAAVQPTTPRETGLRGLLVW